jgi:chorismate synthase
MLTLRQPQGNISTPRKEKDEFKIVSGVFNGKTTGTPITIIIPNENVKSDDYSNIKTVARPSHADYTAECKYHGFQDTRGGGHFSGRITATLVAAGAICKFALEQKGIYIGTHIKRCAGISDREFDNLLSDIKNLNEKTFAVLDEASGEKMQEAIIDAKTDGDSVGGILETAIIGLPAGIGEPWFDTVESLLSHIMFSIPAVKGIEFGAGFSFADMKGSTANDPMKIENGKIITTTNNNGGINGGITNGMPIIFRTAVKPTPTIFKPQNTIDFSTMTETVSEPKGRHDPAIVHRARVVQDAAAAIVMCDILAMRFGTDWLK